MYTRFIKVFPPILLTLFFSLFFLTKINLITADLGRHIRNGELAFTSDRHAMLNTNFYSYTVPDFKFVNHHWLTGVVFYLVYLLTGFNGLSIFAAIISGFTFYLLFDWSRKLNGFWLTLLLSPVFLIFLLLRKEVRPELFSMLFSVIFLMTLLKNWENLGMQNFVWLGIAQILWVNLHIFFVFSIGIVSAFLVHSLLNHRKESTLKLLGLTAFLIAVSLINPFGLAGLLQPFNIFNNYEIQPVENLPLFSTLMLLDLKVIILQFCLILLVSMALFYRSIVLSQAKENTHVFLLFFGSLLLTIFVNRMLSFFVVFAFVYIFKNLHLLKSARYGEPFYRPLAIFIVGMLLIFRFSIDSFGMGLLRNNQDSANFFINNNLRGPVFNNFDIGSYLIFNLYGKEKVFIDNRSEAYPVSFVKEQYLSINGSFEAWTALEARYNFNSVFLHRNKAVDSFLPTLFAFAWKVVFFDDEVAILVKDTNENQELIKNYELARIFAIHSVSKN